MAVLSVSQAVWVVSDVGNRLEGFVGLLSGEVRGVRARYSGGMDLDEQTGLVPRVQIEAHRDFCKQRIIDLGDESAKPVSLRSGPFLKSALAVYDWVLGTDNAPSPFSGMVEPTKDELLRQEKLARRAIYGQRGAPVLSQGEAVGVENTCMWLMGRCPEPPEGLLPDEEVEPEIY